MKLFDLDSPIMRFFTRISELMIVNVLTLVCCIPIITIGPALTAAHYTLLKMVRDEYSYVTKTYFKGFKDNFKKGTIIGLILLVFIVLLVYDYLLITKSGLEFGRFIKIALIVVAVILAMTAMYVFPVLAKFENTVWGTIRNAAIMSVLQLPKTLVMAVVYIIPVYIFAFIAQLWPLLLILGLAVPMYLSAMLYNKFFLTIEANIAAEQETDEQEEADDSEKIFSDKLDESLVVENNGVTPLMNRENEE